MKENSNSDLKNRSLFARLKRLFSTDVVVRNVGGKKLKIIDTDQVQYATDKNSLKDRFNRLRSSAYNSYTRDFNLSYQSSRIELFRDFDCVGPDTIIPLPDGTTPTISELAEKYKNSPNERFFVFSYDHKTDSIQLGKAYNPRKKEGGKRKVWKVTFENDQYIIGSAGHPFLMRNGDYKKLEDLTVGESVMPFYQKDFYKNGYRCLYNFSKGWQSEHKIVAEQFYRQLQEDECVHHVNFDKRNNLPTNLKIMLDKDHRKYHADLNNKVIWSEENKPNTLKKIQNSEGYKNRKFHRWNGTRKGRNNPMYGKKHTVESVNKLSAKLKNVFKNRNQSGELNPNFNNSITIDTIIEKSYEFYKLHGNLKIHELCNYIGCDYELVSNRLKYNNTNWTEFKQNIQNTLNHKIKSIDYIGEMEVYDVTVETYQNFATDSCFVHNTMSMDPILASALDVYADECTSKNEMGDIISIKSNNDDIKSILENLFYDILNVEFNLWSWTRSMVKYGDFYLKLYISPEYGIYMVEPISCYHVTRLENNNVENKNDVKFEISMPEGNGLETLENYEVAHFRLLQDTNFIPYGTSMLDGARRIWKQLCLHENTNILTSNGNKLIKDVVSGDEVYSFDYKTGKTIKTVVKHCKYMGKQDTYKITTSSNKNIITTDNHGMLVCDENGEFVYKATKEINKNNDKLISVDLQNSSSYTLEQIVDISFYEKDSNTWDLEVDHELHNFVAEGVISHNTLMEDAMLIHRIMRAPAKRIFKLDIGNIPPNEIDNFVEQTMNKMKKVPYVDEKTGDYNLRFNLQNMVEDYYLPVRGSDSGTSISDLGGLDWTGTEDIEYLRNKLMSALKIPKAFLGYEEGLCISPETKIILINGTTKTVEQLIEDYNNDVVNYTFSINESTKQIVPTKIEWAGFTRLNTQVVRVYLDNGKHIDCTPDHLFMTNDARWVKSEDLNENQMLMSYATAYLGDENDKNSFFSHTLVFDPRTNMFKHIRDVIKQSEDFNEIDEYLNKNPDNSDIRENHKEGKLFNSVVKVEKLNKTIDTCDLKIKDHHNFATDAGVFIHNSGKSTLAAEDIRFARTIQRIQRIILSELNKIAVIHLYSQGYRDGSLVDFELELTNPSTIFEKEKIEIWKEKVELSSNMQESKLFSKKWVYENVFGLSDKDMTELQKQLIDDSKSNYRFKQIEDEGNDPALAYIKTNGTDEPEDEEGGGGEGGEGEESSPFDIEGSSEPTEPETGGEAGGEEAPLTEKRKVKKKRDQRGRKDARKYPFGEDPLGTLENNRKYDLSVSHNYKNSSPLSLESYKEILNKIDKNKLLKEQKTKKPSYMDENVIKE